MNWDNVFNQVTGVANKYVDYDIAQRNGENVYLYGPPGGGGGGGSGNTNTALIVGGIAIAGVLIAIVALKA